VGAPHLTRVVLIAISGSAPKSAGLLSRKRVGNAGIRTARYFAGTFYGMSTEVGPT
jgi:hypothetical protein